MKLGRMAAVFAAATLVVAACGGDDDDDSGGGATTTTAATGGATTTAATGGATTTAATGGATTTTGSGGGESAADLPATAGEGCGLNNGEKATGDPIKLGNVTTSMPGIDFIDRPGDDGGVLQLRQRQRRHQRPTDPDDLMENDNLKPEDAASAARKLIETDKVVAMVGGFSILDCPVNADYYEEKGYNVIVAGVPAECFSSPNIAAANMGPGYSALGCRPDRDRQGRQGQDGHDRPARPRLRTTTTRWPASTPSTTVSSGKTSSPSSRSPTRPRSSSTLVNKAGEGGGVIAQLHASGRSQDPEGR